ncbi:MAG: acylphosphatase [Candidatus Lambdaproteobacteria bacterium]|nr:acylphosphatase [Candidatus Lambdaproteobacteria bacterium]
MSEVLHIVVRGHVQGVGYRYYAESVATQYGIAGWVRNLPSGEVELLARVAPGDRSAFLAALQQGPPHCRVEGMRVGPAPRGLDCPEHGFSVRF